MSLIDEIINLTKFLFPCLNAKCEHDKIKPDVTEAYCPDCGKLIRNEWYITRCACCGVKMKTIVKNGDIMPQLHYCANCGSADFTVEKIDIINFININFAALVKCEIDEEKIFSTTICRQEKTPELLKLPVQYL